MTIIEKYYKNIKLTSKEEQKEKLLFLNFLADIKLISSSLPELQKNYFNKLLGLLLIYFPKDYKQMIIKNFTPNDLEKLIKEEKEND